MANKMHFVCPDCYDGKIYAKTQSYLEQLYVDLRRHFKPSDKDEWLPGPRGINFNLDQWKEILKNLDDITKAVEKKERYDLSIEDGKIKVTVRQWKNPVQYIGFKMDRREQPGHPPRYVGVTFTVDGFKSFLKVVKTLNKELGL